MMKTSIGQAVRAACGWPLIGHPLRIAIALIRLPDWRDRAEYARQQQQEQQQRQHAALEQELSALRRALAGMAERQQAMDASHSLALRDMAAKTEMAAMAALLEQTRQETQAALGQAGQRHEQTASRLDSLTGTADYLLGRLEFMRRELMFEMRYGAGAGMTGAGLAAAGARVDAEAAGSAGDHGLGAVGPGGVDAAGAGNGGFTPLRANTQVLAPDKLAAARVHGIRLNLGCGHLPLAGYLNVDRRPMPGVDVVAEADALPFGAGEVAEISSAHLLEHFPQEQLRRQLLPYFHLLLRPGGRLHAVVPDAAAMLAAHAEGHYPYEDLREVLYGAQDYDGDFHFTMFTPASLSALLEEAGFDGIDVLAAGRRNGRCYEFEISAVKPDAGKLAARGGIDLAAQTAG